MSPTTVLAAAVAAAIVSWWSRRSPAEESLPTIALPGLAPPGAPASAATGGGGPHPATLACILAAGGMVAWAIAARPAPPPAPGPSPAPVAGLNLRGTFVGQDAAVDAGVTSALLAELADCLEQDGLPKVSGAEPRLRTGAQFDDLRRTARELRCRGVSLGQKHPLAREAIAKYLDGAVGTDGGPVDAAGRARWVAAYRTVAQAAAEAAGGSR